MRFFPIATEFNAAVMPTQCGSFKPDQAQQSAQRAMLRYGRGCGYVALNSDFNLTAPAEVLRHVKALLPQLMGKLSTPSLLGPPGSQFCRVFRLGLRVAKMGDLCCKK